MLQCYNDKDNVGIDEAARLQRQRTTSMDSALAATLLIAVALSQRDGRSGYHHDKDNAEIDETARLQRQWQC